MAKKEESKLQHKINAIVLQAKMSGINSFVLGFKNPEDNKGTIHFEQIPMGDAVNICAFGWLQSLRNELKAHPEYKEDYAAIFKDAIVDFEKLTAKINKKVAEYIK